MQLLLFLKDKIVWILFILSPFFASENPKKTGLQPEANLW